MPTSKPKITQQLTVQCQVVDDIKELTSRRIGLSISVIYFLLPYILLVELLVIMVEIDKQIVSTL